MLRGSTVRAIVDIADAVHAVEADEGQISQVLNNIIINASQAMPGGGKLSITAKNLFLLEKNSHGLAAGNYIQVTLKDEGCGISREIQEKIFDPYFTTKIAGTGLGLASAYSIIVKHQGALAAATPYRAVIVDLTIPGGLGGVQAAEQILAIAPSACLIVSSGYSNDPIMADYRRYGFSAAIAKPYNISDFEEALRSLPGN